MGEMVYLAMLCLKRSDDFWTCIEGYEINEEAYNTVEILNLRRMVKIKPCIPSLALISVASKAS